MFQFADARQGQRIASGLTYARVCVWANRIWIAGHDAAGNAVLEHDDGTVEMLGPTPGHWDVAFDWQGNVIWQQTGQGGTIRPILGGTPTVIPGWDYQAEGILDITPAGQIIMCGGSTRTLGVTLADGSSYLLPLWMTRGDWTIGQATVAPPGVVCYHAPTKKLWRVYTGDYQIPPRLSDDGTAAITGNPAQFSTPSQWTEEPLAPPLPDIQPFTTPKIVAPYPAPNGDLSTRTKGENSFVAYGVVMDPIGALVEHPESEKLRDWIDTEQGQAIPSGECIVYCDIGKVPLGLKPWQVAAFNAYPEPGETKDQFKARIQAAIDHVSYDYILVAACWNRGTLTDQEVLDGMAVVRELAE